MNNLNKNRIKNIEFIWSKSVNLRLIFRFGIFVFIFIFLFNLIAFNDVESIIIFDIFLIFLVSFNLLKQILLKQVYTNRNYFLSSIYLNFFFRKRILLNLYLMIFRTTYTILLLKQLIMLFEELITDELETSRLNYLIFLKESNNILLNSLVNDSLIKYNKKLEFIIKDIYYDILQKSLNDLLK